MVWLNDFSAEILLQELPLDGGFAWPTIYFNIIWKEMLFTRCAILQWNTHQAFIALWFLSFIYCYSFVRHAYHHWMSKHSILSENFGYTHVWLFMWFVCIACVPLYSTVQPQSGTILFFPHFYIWSKWIDKSSRTWQFDLLRFYSALGINTWLIFL